MPIRTIDLCAGIGGIRRGFELTGAFRNVLSAEIDRFACLTYEHLYGENPLNDVTSVEFKEKLKTTDYDVLLAGFPCQSFSKAGLEKGFDDSDKGGIFHHIVEIIRSSRPKAVFLENVDNLVRHNKGETFKFVLKTMEIDLGYKVIGVSYESDEQLVYKASDFVRNSRDFGIPQNRPRTYIMAFDRGYYRPERLLALDDALPLNNDLCLYRDLNDNLLEFHADPKYYMASGYLATLFRHKERERKRGNGFGYRIANDTGIEHPFASTIMATGGAGKERNLVRDPQEGIAGLIVPGKKTPLNDQGIRVMTPREWGKLQGFVNFAFIDENGVDHFTFPEGMPMSQQYKQLGNAVTIPVIKTMAEFMLRCFSQLDD